MNRAAQNKQTWKDELEEMANSEGAIAGFPRVQLNRRSNDLSGTKWEAASNIQLRSLGAHCLKKDIQAIKLKINHY